jgi:hypothetical protein
LYVDRLPPNYRDMGEFRRIFSVFKSPPYCQVSLILFSYFFGGEGGSDPWCLSSSSALHFFRLFFSCPPPCQPG